MFVNKGMISRPAFHLFTAGLVWLSWTGFVPALARAQGSSQEVRFNRDIRPILSDTCFTCHGPDKSKRITQLRFDTEAGAFADLGKFRASFPATGQRAKWSGGSARGPSRADAAQGRSGRHLTQGADRADPALGGSRGRSGRSTGRSSRRAARARRVTEDRPGPQCRSTASSSPGSKREGLAPSPEADRTTLIRRVTLDLTGLPPTPAEVDAFLADRSPDAYEKVVDRLLASPRYGERMAMRWLDAARYADTNGYQTDGERYMWRWRDWVIEALQPQPAVRPVHHRADSPATCCRAPRSTRRSPPASTATTAATPRAGSIPEEYARRVRRRPRRDHGDRLARPDAGLRPLPRPQVRPGHAEGVLPSSSPSSTTCPRRGRPRSSATRRRSSRLRRPSSRRSEGARSKLAAAETPMQRARTRADRGPGAWEKSRMRRTGRSDGCRATGPSAARSTATSGSCVRGGKDERRHLPRARRRFGLDGAAQAGASTGRKRFVEAGDVGDFGFDDRFSLGGWVKPHGAERGHPRADDRRADGPTGTALYWTRARCSVHLVQALAGGRARGSRRASRCPQDRWHHVVGRPTTARAGGGREGLHRRRSRS